MLEVGFDQRFRAVYRRSHAWLTTLVQELSPARFTGNGAMETHERVTLEIGSAVVLAALAMGLQIGEWPVWTAVFAVGGYFAWAIAYSEATVQARRWSPQRLATLEVDLAAKPAPPPA
jgi:hypothetical protein